MPGRRIEQHDPLALVHGDDRIHRRVDDARQAQLAFQASLGHSGDDLGIPAAENRQLAEKRGQSPAPVATRVWRDATARDTTAEVSLRG
jgi:hypothetical protein